MPSTATITSFYVFVPYSKARASYLNSNFSIWRGNIIPISDSITASDQEYDLGSSDHRWNNAYISGISLSISSGSSHVFSGTTDGGFKFTKDNTTTFSVTDGYFEGQNATPLDPTTSCAIGNMAQSSALNSTITTSTMITASVCYFYTSGKRPFFVGLKQVEGTVGSIGVELYDVTSTNDTIIRIRFNIGSIGFHIDSLGQDPLPDSTVVRTQHFYTPGCFGTIIDKTIVAGTITLYLSTETTTTSASLGIFRNVKLYAYEL